MIRTFSSLAAAIGFAAPALAGTIFTAELAEPVAERTEVIANSAIWVCEETTCVAELNRSRATVRTCKRVAEETGTLVSFQSERGALDEADLAECNEAAED